MSDQNTRIDQIERQMLVDRNATNALLYKQDEMHAELKNVNNRLDRIESLLQLMMQTINEMNERLPPKKEE